MLYRKENLIVCEYILTTVKILQILHSPYSISGQYVLCRKENRIIRKYNNFYKKKGICFVAYAFFVCMAYKGRVKEFDKTFTICFRLRKQWQKICYTDER